MRTEEMTFPWGRIGRGAVLRGAVAAVLAAAAALLAPGCGARAARTVTVTFFSTGDLHDQTANLPRIARFVADRRREGANVLFVDAGDRFNKGEMPMMFSRGEAVMAIVGACGYDAAAIGNHDLSFGADRLGRLADRFHVPLTAANVRWPAAIAPAVAAPYRIFRLDGVTVAVVGAASEVMNHRSDDLLGGLPVEQAVATVVRRARREADIVILLTHNGDRRDQEIARAVPGLDAILGGHSHSVFRTMVVEPNSGTLIHKAGQAGRHIGEVVLTWDGRRIIDRRTRIIDVTDDMPEDPHVRAVRQRYLDALPEGPIARLPRNLKPAELTRWITEAVRTQTGADVVLAPASLAKLGLPAGPFTAESLEVIPRLEVACFDVPDAARLEGVLGEVRRNVKDARLFGPPTPDGKSPIRVAYPCVRHDEMIDANASGLGGRTVREIDRLRDRSLWQIVVAEALRRGEIAAPPAP